MGYDAEADGTVSIKKEYIDEIESIAENSELAFCHSKKGGFISIYVSSCKYREDKIIERLNYFNKYISDGNLDFTGEDCAHWRFVFDPSVNEWKKENGEVIYDSVFGDYLSGFSDKELIKELESRGYNVI